ncbi:MAG: T9SS type A sorting domain-containing protein, partial [Candidatus Poribacteria bacterium]|nr:T9SS type A sorting domain-containing protein [Candidatus Poribacteria bacterium]
ESIRIQNVVLSDRNAQYVPFRVERQIRFARQATPMTYRLGQNYPNPFNPETWIPYQLATAEEVKLQIYDASGHLVRNLDLGFQAAGAYMRRDNAVHWDGRNLRGEQVASGVYFYQIQAGEFVATKKMVILK